MVRIVLFILIFFQTNNACTSVPKGQVKNHIDQVIDNYPHISDDSIRCDILVVKYTEVHLNELLYDDLYKFLYTFLKDCSQNVEYSEYSNEILFKVLENYPEQFINCLSTGKGLDLDYIFSELSAPLHDIDSKTIYEKVQNVSGDMLFKEKILESLTKAMVH